MGFAKIHSKIASSSINEEELHVRWLWVIMLANANATGQVFGTVGALARLANITRDQADNALGILQSPDPESTTETDDGRRILKIGGNEWFIINHEYYRKKEDYDRTKELTRLRVQKHRQKINESLAGNADVTVGNTCNDKQRHIPEADSDSDAHSSQAVPEDRKADSPKPKPRFKPPSRAELVEYITEKRLEKVDPDAFIDFYESKGWMVGKNKMKDWKAAARNWNRSSRGGNGKQVSQAERERLERIAKDFGG